MNALLGGKQSGGSHGNSNNFGGLATSVLSGLSHNSNGNHGSSGGHGGGSSGLGGKIVGQLASNLFSSGSKPQQQNNYHGGQTAQTSNSGGLAGALMGQAAHMFGGQSHSTVCGSFLTRMPLCQKQEKITNLCLPAIEPKLRVFELGPARNIQRCCAACVLSAAWHVVPPVSCTAIPHAPERPWCSATIVSHACIESPTTLDAILSDANAGTAESLWAPGTTYSEFSATAKSIRRRPTWLPRHTATRPVRPTWSAPRTPSRPAAFTRSIWWPPPRLRPPVQFVTARRSLWAPAAWGTSVRRPARRISLVSASTGSVPNAAVVLQPGTGHPTRIQPVWQ